MEKQEKRGFWSFLFPTRNCRCGNCQDSAAHTEEQPAGAAVTTAAPRTESRKILVLGPGCSKCRRTYEVVTQVVQASGLPAQVTEVNDIQEILRYDVLSTPAVVIDGKVAVKGKVPSAEEVRQLLGIKD